MTVSILIVDDSLPMRGVIKKTIRASGFGQAEFEEAQDGEAAMAVLKDKWVDIVVTDYNMPKMNGLQLIEEMKKDDVLKTIPVIVITTEGSTVKVNEFIHKGAAGYIKKPFAPEEIRNKLHEILGDKYDDQGFEDTDEGFDF